MKAIVIGAGIIGAGVAFRLSEAGVSVTLIDGNRVGGGTSGTSFSWFNSNNKTPRPYHDLNVAGMKAHIDLKEELGSAPWLHSVGGIEWVAGDEKRAVQKLNVERMKSWGYPIDFITHKELGELEPDLDLDAIADASITFSPTEGWVDPVVYAHAMVLLAKGRGAILKTGSKVVEILQRNGKAAGVRTEDGSVFEADIVVNCAGRWADLVSRDAAFQLPLAPTVGFIAFTPPVATSIAHPMLSPTIDLRPDGAGRLMLHHPDLDQGVGADADVGATAPQAVELMRRAVAIIPSLNGVKPEAARVTARPIPSDGLSAVGPVPQIEGYYFVVSHSGVTLAALFARLVADEIAHGRLHRMLEPFRTARFFN